MIRAGWICFCGVTEEYCHELKLKLNVLLMSTVVMANNLSLRRFNQKPFDYFCHKKKTRTRSIDAFWYFVKVSFSFSLSVWSARELVGLYRRIGAPWTPGPTPTAQVPHQTASDGPGKSAADEHPLLCVIHILLCALWASNKTSRFFAHNYVFEKVYSTWFSCSVDVRFVK